MDPMSFFDGDDEDTEDEGDESEKGGENYKEWKEEGIEQAKVEEEETEQTKGEGDNQKNSSKKRKKGVFDYETLKNAGYAAPDLKPFIQFHKAQQDKEQAQQAKIERKTAKRDVAYSEAIRKAQETCAFVDKQWNMMGKPEAPDKPRREHSEAEKDATWFTQKHDAKKFKPPTKPHEKKLAITGSTAVVTVNTQKVTGQVVRLDTVTTDSNGRVDNTQTLRNLEKALGMNLRKKKGEPKDYISEMLLDDLKKTNAGRGN